MVKTKILSVFFYIFARLLLASYRFRFFGVDNFESAKEHHSSGSAFCLASWHEHTLAGILGQVGIPYCLLVSPSKDGDFVEYFSSRLGFKSVRGSSSRGGKHARLEMLAKIGQGFPAAFTVDGPRGPRRKSKPGILAISCESRTKILPVAAVSDNFWTLSKTWDQTKIPKPFSKIVYQYGDPIDAHTELKTQSFEDILEKIEIEIDKTEKLAFTNIKNWEHGTKKIPNIKV